LAEEEQRQRAEEEWLKAEHEAEATRLAEEERLKVEREVEAARLVEEEQRQATEAQASEAEKWDKEDRRAKAAELQAEEEYREAERRAATDPQPGADEPTGGQPDEELSAEDMAVDGGGGEVKVVDGTVARGGASSSNYELVLHDKPAEASADDLIAAYRKKSPPPQCRDAGGVRRDAALHCGKCFEFSLAFEVSAM
jgi:hypothetical protein